MEHADINDVNYDANRDTWTGIMYPSQIITNNYAIKRR